jgi:hypothetical protein
VFRKVVPESDRQGNEVIEEQRERERERVTESVKD